MATYAYARLSVTDDASVSINDQLAKCLAYAVATDRVVEETFVDYGYSGKTLERPRAQELMDRMCPGDTVIVVRLDRLTRSVADINVLMNKGIVVVSVSESLDTSTAAGRMVINMIATFAQYERELIVERTTASIDRRRLEGKVYSGQVPFGWTAFEGKLIKNEPEQVWLAKITQLRAQGHSFHALAAMLNAPGGPKPRRASKWHDASVRAMLGAKINKVMAA